MKGKWILTASVASALIGSVAHATIARQVVVGGQNVFTAAGSGVVSNVVNGSLWYDDDYNVFYNPSYVMDYKNYVVVQKGMEGGFFKGEFENFAYGVYVNRGTTPGTNYAGYLVGPGLRANTSLAGVNGSMISTQRPVDFFFAGDTGIKWGAHISWAYNRDQTIAAKNREDDENTSRYWHFDLGAQVMGFEPFIGATLFSKAQSGASKVEQSLNQFNTGVRYKWEGWTPYIAFTKHREGATPPGAARQIQTRFNTLALGVGHDTKVADGVHVLKHIGIVQSDVEDDAGATEAAKNYRDRIVPIDFAIEAEATSWLTLRAGARYDLFNERKYAHSSATQSLDVADKVASNAGTVTARIGSTIKFGKLALDSALGTGAGAGAASLDGTNAGFDSQTFAMLSATYRW